MIAGTIATLVSVTASVLVRVFARRVVTPTPYPREPLSVRAVNRQTTPASVSLSRGEDADLEGKFSLVFGEAQGHAQVGKILGSTSHTVTRELLGEQRGELRVGVSARITGWWWIEAQELGIPYSVWHIPTPHGYIEAHLFTPKQAQPGKFALHVHGRGARWQETLRGVPPLAELGVSSLVITYRNDPEAYPAPDQRYGLGMTEYRDVLSAYDALVKEGATSVLLVGWSMGGTAVLLAAEQPQVRETLAGMVLESPAIDWPTVLVHHAGMNRIPPALARRGIRLLFEQPHRAGLQAPLQVSTLTVERFASSLRVPCLVMASAKDTFVPAGPAIRFANVRNDLVTLYLTQEGEHVKLWNVSPAEWEAQLRNFAGKTLKHDSRWGSLE